MSSRIRFPLTGRTGIALSGARDPTTLSAEDVANRWALVAFVSIILGLEFFLVPLATLSLFLRPRSASLSSLDLLVFGLAATFTASATIAAMGGANLQRIFSSAYSVAIIVAGYSFARLLLASIAPDRHGKPSRPEDARRAILLLGRMGSAILALSAMLFAMGIIHVVVAGGGGLSFPTLLAAAANEGSPGMIQYMASTRVYRLDWAFGSAPVPRFIYFARWDTAGAIIIAVAATAAGAAYLLEGRRSKFWQNEALSVLLIASTLSRTVIVAYAVGSVFTYLSVARNKAVVISIILLVAPAVLAIGYASLDRLASFRSYSTQDRFELYDAAVQVFVSAEPLLGLGVKPKDGGEYEYAIGSHSMVLSSLVRGGLVAAVLAAVVFWILPATYTYRLWSKSGELGRLWPIFGRGVFVIFVWTLFQEVDTSMLSFTAIALLLLEVRLLARQPPRTHL